MDLMRLFALGFAGALALVTITGYIPGTVDQSGKIFGIFRLTWYNDLLHGASALWAAIAYSQGRAASISFLKIFGTLYFIDGLMGLLLGSGYLDLGIVIWGIQNLPLNFRLVANAPHLVLGGIGIIAGFFLSKRA